MSFTGGECSTQLKYAQCVFFIERLKIQEKYGKIFKWDNITGKMGGLTDMILI